MARRRPLVVTALASGSGKTVLTLGLAAALRQRALAVQPFKVGPDYLDPAWLSMAAGRPARSLDTHLMGALGVRASVARALVDDPIPLVEGVLGLCDGRLGGDGDASTAMVARLIGARLLLVVDIAGTAGTAAAVPLGLRALAPDLECAGVILNRAGGARHAAEARRAVEATGVPVLGVLPRDPACVLPERYLGLIPPAERRPAAGWLERCAALVAQHVDLDAVLRATRGGVPAGAEARAAAAALWPEPPPPPRVRIAVAGDEAFHFTYPDALDMLRHRGAELVPWSPLRDPALPPAIHGVFIPGGFPEQFAAELAANAGTHAGLRAAADRGRPILAECGGAMLCGRALQAPDGAWYPMAGLTSLRAAWSGGRRTLGYRTLRAARSTWWARRGTRLRAHEFHASVAEAPPAPDLAAYRLPRGPGPGALEGYALGAVQASYMHVHLVGCPEQADRFVRACARSGAVAA